MAAMDATDRLIVDALRADGRLSMRALADLVHISRANVYARVSRLERDGVITGYAAIIDPGRYGYALSAYVYLDIAQRSWKQVRGQLLAISEVDHVALVSGEHDILLRVRGNPRGVPARRGAHADPGDPRGPLDSDGPNLRGGRSRPGPARARAVSAHARSAPSAAPSRSRCPSRP